MPIRLTAGYSDAISTSFDNVVPILLIPSYDLNPEQGDCQPIGGSFVTQVAAALEAWRQTEEPQASGSYMFDLALHARAWRSPANDPHRLDALSVIV